VTLNFFVIAIKFLVSHLNIYQTERCNKDNIRSGLLRWERVKTAGFSRERIKTHFRKDVYDRRPQVDTVNSMVKRKMGVR
jgi:hypothetical protein